MPAAELSVALALARNFLNDTNATVWTDANLIPSMQQATYELNAALWDIGSPDVRAITGPILVANVVDPNINPLLPEDFARPTHIDECGVTSSSIVAYTDLVINADNPNIVTSAAHPFETTAEGFLLDITGGAGFNVGPNVILFVDASNNATLQEPAGDVGATGGTGTATYGVPDNLWVSMTEAFFLPIGAVPQGKLIWWNWQKQLLQFIGASANRFINIQYIRQVPIPQAATDNLQVFFAELYLGARGAAIAAGSVGNAAAAGILDGEAKVNLGKVLTANRGQQKPVNRP